MGIYLEIVILTEDCANLNPLPQIAYVFFKSLSPPGKSAILQPFPKSGYLTPPYLNLDPIRP